MRNPSLTLAFLALSAHALSASPQTVEDAWSELHEWSTEHPGWGATAIHAILLPPETPQDGPTILFVGFRRDGATVAIDPAVHKRYAWRMDIPQIGAAPACSPGSTSTTIVSTVEEAQPGFDEILIDEDMDMVDDFLEVEDMFCMGHSLLSDGRVFTAGGTLFRYDVQAVPPVFEFVLGTDYGTVYDPFDSNPVTRWQCTGNLGGMMPPDCSRNRMVGLGAGGSTRRWYPSVTRLEDGRMLVIGGYVSFTGPGLNYLTNRSVEIYDPVANTWTEVLTEAASDNAVLNRNYPHPFLLPEPIDRGGVDYEVVLIGECGRPSFLTTSNPASISVSNAFRPGGPTPGCTPAGATMVGPDFSASSALLPLRLDNDLDGAWAYENGSFLVAGGTGPFVPENESIDVYDPTADAWRYSMAMGVDETMPPDGVPDAVGRQNPATVLLPNGQVAILAGDDPMDAGNDAPQHALYLDPSVPVRDGMDDVVGFDIQRGTCAMGELRSYHTSALLLPDGRVLVGGGAGPMGAFFSEQTSFRYLYPPYLVGQGGGAPPVRPKILECPDVLTYGSSPIVRSSLPPARTEVALIGFGAMTHACDFNQRYVQLDFKPVRKARVTPAVAPPFAGAGPGTGIGRRDFAIRIEIPAASATPSGSRLIPPGYYMLFLVNKDHPRRVPSIAKIVQVTH